MPDATSSVDARSVGERIERLLDASAASGPMVGERAEELVRLVVELYGAGLERVLELAYEAGALSDDLLDALADDDLVSGSAARAWSASLSGRGAGRREPSTRCARTWARTAAMSS